MRLGPCSGLHNALSLSDCLVVHQKHVYLWVINESIACDMALVSIRKLHVYNHDRLRGFDFNFGLRTRLEPDSKPQP